MLTSIDDKLIFNWLLLFSSEIILQIADVVRRVEFLLVLVMFFSRETSEMFRRRVCTPAAKATQPRAQLFSVNYLVFRQ